VRASLWPEGVDLPEQFILTCCLFEGERVCLRRWECGSETGVEFHLTGLAALAISSAHSLPA
jgi:hypothetical protein